MIYKLKKIKRENDKKSSIKCIFSPLFYFVYYLSLSNNSHISYQFTTNHYKPLRKTSVYYHILHNNKEESVSYPKIKVAHVISLIRFRKQRSRKFKHRYIATFSELLLYRKSIIFTWKYVTNHWQYHQIKVFLKYTPLNLEYTKHKLF